MRTLEFLGSVYGYWITASDQVAEELLAANQLPNHVGMRTLKISDVDSRQ